MFIRSSVLAKLAAVLALSTTAEAFSPSAAQSLGLKSQILAASAPRPPSAQNAAVGVRMQEAEPQPLIARREAMGGMAALAAGLALRPSQVMAEAEYKALENGKGIQYSVIKDGKGPKPKIGDFVAIRFKASFNGKAFDDCFKTQNAYYYRVGDENIVQGLDIAVQQMRVGDRWLLKVPPELAFGEKGVKPSPGKPRIPGNATIEYEVLFEIFPGAEEEILEITNGDYPS